MKSWSQARSITQGDRWSEMVYRLRGDLLEETISDRQNVTVENLKQMIRILTEASMMKGFADLVDFSAKIKIVKNELEARDNV